jgi:hypothetical protein
MARSQQERLDAKQGGRNQTTVHRIPLDNDDILDNDRNPKSVACRHKCESHSVVHDVKTDLKPMPNEICFSGQVSIGNTGFLQRCQTSVLQDSNHPSRQLDHLSMPLDARSFVTSMNVFKISATRTCEVIAKVVEREADNVTLRVRVLQQKDRKQRLLQENGTITNNHVLLKSDEESYTDPHPIKRRRERLVEQVDDEEFMTLEKLSVLNQAKRMKRMAIAMMNLEYLQVKLYQEMIDTVQCNILQECHRFEGVKNNDLATET